MNDITTFAQEFVPDVRLRTKYIVWVIVFGGEIVLGINGMIALIDIFDPTFPDIVREGMLHYSTMPYAFAIVLAIIGSNLYCPTIRYVCAHL